MTADVAPATDAVETVAAPIAGASGSDTHEEAAPVSDSLAPTLTNGAVSEALPVTAATPAAPVENATVAVGASAPIVGSPAPAFNDTTAGVVAVTAGASDTLPAGLPDPDPTFEEHMGMSLDMRAQILFGRGDDTALDFVSTLEHSLHAHAVAFAANLAAFEADVMMHIERVINDIKQGKGLF